MRGLILSTMALLAVSLAGCANAPEGGDAHEPHSDALVEIPEWVVGQYWSYTTTSAEGATGAIQLAVTGEQGGDWIVDTNDVTMAYYDDMIDVSYVGPVSKSNLEGKQGSDRIKFFQFPLELNKTWTTKWDGETQTVTVKHIMDDGNVHLMAHNDVGMTADYEYNPEAGFFEYITFFDQNGTEQYRMERADHGLGYDGQAIRMDIQDPVVFEAQALSTFQGTQSFGDATEMRVILHAFCNDDKVGQIMMGMSVKPDDEMVHLPPIPNVMEPQYGMQHDCSAGQAMVDDVGIVPLDAGESWNIDIGTFSQNGHGLIVVEPRIVETLVGPFA